MMMLNLVTLAIKIRQHSSLTFTKRWLVVVRAACSHPQSSSKVPELCSGRHTIVAVGMTHAQSCVEVLICSSFKWPEGEGLVAMMIHLYDSLFQFHFCCCDKVPLTNSSLLEKGCGLACDSGLQSVTAEKQQWQEHETIGHIISTVKSRKK